MDNTMPEFENMFNLIKDLENLIPEASKADRSNAVVNEYLAANPHVAKTLLDSAKAWNARTVNRGWAEARVRSCGAKIAKLQASIAADRDMIASWTKQINDARGEILRLQKALKEAESEAAKAQAELNALG